MWWSFWYCLVSLCVEGFTTKFQPLNPKQAKFQEMIHAKDKTILLGVGSAGTGKTLLSCQESLNLLFHKKIKKIVLTRPTISVEDEQIGFLPGSLEDKMSPWTRPFFDNLLEFYSANEIQRLMQENKVEICPLGFMRGRTFRDCIIILDEAQNTTPKQMKMILTRIGHNCKIIVVGDTKQSDITGINGLHDVLSRLHGHYRDKYYRMTQDGIAIVRFEDHQIVRHPIIETIVRIYDDEDTDGLKTFQGSKERSSVETT